MKKLRRILLVLFLIVVVAVVGGFIYVDKILKSTIETQATKSLKLNTTLNTARLALMGGTVNLNQLRIGSPEKYTAPNMFEMGDLTVNVAYGQLTNEPVHIKRIEIKQPKFVLEQLDGKMNFKEVMDSLPPTDPNAKIVKVVIEELAVIDAIVELRLGKIAGIDLKQMEIKIPSMVLKDIGNSDGSNNGAAIKDVVMQLATALAGKAGDNANFPDQLKGILSANLKDVGAKLGKEFNKQLGGMTQNLTKGLQGELDKALKNAIPGVDLKNIVPGVDLNKSLDSELKKVIPGDFGKLIPGNDKKKPKSDPKKTAPAAPPATDDGKAAPASEKLPPEADAKIIPDVDLNKIIPGVDQKIDTQKMIGDLFGKKKKDPKKETKKAPEVPEASNPQPPATGN